jgi:hypothetical protein
MNFSRSSIAVIGFATAALVLLGAWLIAELTVDASRQSVTHSEPTQLAELDPTISDNGGPEAKLEEQVTSTTKRSFADELIVARRQAEAGDAVAMRRLGEIYDDCHYSTFVGASYVSDIKTKVAAMQLSPMEKARAVELAFVLQTQCAGVEGGKPYPQELSELNYREAALQGDLAARVIADGLDGKLLEESHADELAEQAIRQRNASALVELFRFLPPDTRLAIRGVDGGISVAALAAFGCEIDPSLCGPSSRMVINFCVYALQCNAYSVPELISRYYISEALRQQIPDELRRLRG